MISIQQPSEVIFAWNYNSHDGGQIDEDGIKEKDCQTSRLASKRVAYNTTLSKSLIEMEKGASEVTYKTYTFIWYTYFWHDHITQGQICWAKEDNAYNVFVKHN